MELTERKKKVLRCVVDLYIRTAEPVGSKAIAQLPDMQYSSATIRNEMAELTTMGYLEQPHTSAGRVPAPAGYRLYVDELMADSHGLTEITFPEEQDDPVWVIWFNWDGDPYECKVMGVKVTDNSMTVIAHDKICNDEVTCSTPFELGAKNIDWLYEIYDAVWQQLEENRDNNAQRLRL